MAYQTPLAIGPAPTNPPLGAGSVENWITAISNAKEALTVQGISGQVVVLDILGPTGQRVLSAFNPGNGQSVNIRSRNDNDTALNVYGNSATQAANPFNVFADSTHIAFAVLPSGAGTCPGAGTSSERFGSGSLAAGNSSLALGNGASAAGLNSLALGQGATVSGAATNGFAIGEGAVSTAVNAVAIGTLANAGATGAFCLGTGVVISVANGVGLGLSASVGGANGIAIGASAAAIGVDSMAFGAQAAAGHDYAKCFGVLAQSTATHQLIFGGMSSSGDYITDAYVGSNVTDPTPVAATWHASGGSGTNIAGANLTMAGGKGTGSAAGGELQLSTAPAGSSGTTLNALANYWALPSTGELQTRLLSSTSVNREVGRVYGAYVVSTDATRQGRLVLAATDYNANREGLRIEADGTNARVGVAGQAPTARLHLPAGAAGANLAPFKLTTGPLQTTAEAGAVEFATPTFYGTPVTTRRALGLSSDSVTSDTTVANSVAETTLFTGTVAANELSAGKVLRCRVYGRMSALVTDTVTLRFKVGGTTFLTIVSTAAAITGQEWSAEFVITCRTTGAAGTLISQVWAIINNSIQSAADSGTHTVDTTAAENVTVTAQWSAASASDTITLQQGYLELFGG